MARRKKGFNYNFILIVLAIVGGTWIAADFWFNVWRHPQKEAAVEAPAVVPAVKTETPAAVETVAPVLENGFKNETYRDERFGFELQYPVFAAGDPQCPKLEKTEDGFSLGIFSFLVAAKLGTLDEFIDSELQGMAVDGKKTITVGGNAAIKADYQTGGMGWYGSSVFIERRDKFFEFGLLANESSAKCGGTDDYADRVYQLVISTLKFTN
jgi:hypothetical protein